jgi:regulator of sigma E protease
MEWLSSLGAPGDALRFIIVVIEAILVLNLMILVHEWGHFLAARWRGLKVEKFYIWFGKPIWKRTYNGVEYGLGSVPLGGFVQLPQMGPMGGLEGETEGAPLPQITPLDKIIVAFAGPLFSFLLALFFAVLVSWIGFPDRHASTTVIGHVVKDAPADKAGLKPGDKVLEVDGVAIHSWTSPINSLTERVVFSKGEKVELLIERPGVEKPFIVSTGFMVEEGSWFNRRGLRKIGVANAHAVVVESVLKGSAADRAGLKAGDAILKLDGQALFTSFPIQDAAEAKELKPMALTVKRGAEELAITLTPIRPTAPDPVPEAYHAFVNSGITFGNPEWPESKPAVADQIVLAATQVKRTFGAVFDRVFRRTGDVGPQQLGGPVKIINLFYTLFQMPSGWKLVLWFSVILNVNLALMNLMPFPVFDGGHIVMSIGEWIKKGAVLPMKAMEWVQTGCVVGLLCMFGYITWFDIWELKSKPTTESLDVKTVVYPAP